MKQLEVFLTGLVLSIIAATPTKADVVTDWNGTFCEVLVGNTEFQNPGMASRSMAMMNLAIYDAFAMTSSTGSMFFDYGQGHASPGMISASREAAAAQAAYTVLSGVYADQAATLNEALGMSLAGVTDAVAKAEGVTLGTQIGEAILGKRAHDGYDAMSQYMPTYEVGHWQPDPLNPNQVAWGPAWGDVQPFALDSNRQFMPPPMPELTSDEYTRAFDEVKSLGALNSTERTEDQEEIAIFWAYDRLGMGTPMRLYNEALQVISDQEETSTAEKAKLFAKASVAMADAGIVAWNSKFEYDFWRPVTGIRQAAHDGNDDTDAVLDWVPMGAPGGDGTDFTPPFPTYVSGHATFGGALFNVLTEFYGRDDIAFTLASDELDGATRSFTSFSQAMAENGRSRVFMGIHWDFDDLIGRELGGDVASYLFSRPFRAAVPEPGAGWILLGWALVASTKRLQFKRSR